VIDSRSVPAPLRSIALRTDRVRALLGLSIPDQRIAELLKSIELEVVAATAGSLQVTIPSFRFDLEREVDLIEEVARLHGLDQITPVPSAAAPNPNASDKPVREMSALRNWCIHLELQEAVTYSLISEALLDLFDRGDAASRIALPRPVTVDQAILRTRLTPQIVETLGRNRARQISQAAIFEIGTVYHRDATEQYRETRHLAAGLMGRPSAGGVLNRKPPTREEMFGAIKGLWEQVAASSRLTGWKLDPAAVPFLEPGYSFSISIGGNAAGWLGLILPGILKEWRLNDPIGVVEINASLVAHHTAERITYKPVPAFPSVSRDVALVADQNLRHEDLVAAMKKAGPAELESIELFDIFTGASLGTGKRSLAYSLTYRSASRTLTDDEVNGYHDEVKGALKRTLNVEIREN